MAGSMGLAIAAWWPKLSVCAVTRLLIFSRVERCACTVCDSHV